MEASRARIAVIGGANVDIGGFPEGALTMGDSMPGRVRASSGGVGRNIAENAARLGLDVELITALGDDFYGHMLLEDCRRAGIGTAHCRVEPGGRTSVYLFVDDPGGDLLCAVNDMAIQRTLMPDFLEGALDRLGEVCAVALDANLPEESIRYLAEAVRAPLFADAVSAAKVGKLRGALPKLHSLKINRIEAELLTGATIASISDAFDAAHRLNDTGVARVYLTLGPQGAVCASGDARHVLPRAPRAPVNATGAGDAFAAALLWAHGEGLDLAESGLAGVAAAAIAVGAMETVSPRMGRENLLREMEALRPAFERANRAGASGSNASRCQSSFIL